MHKIASFLFPSRKTREKHKYENSRETGEKSEPGDRCAALVMTGETRLTAKSFQRAFIAVKGIFLFLSMHFQVFSALLFFKILGMARHKSTDFYHFHFFMTRLAKSRQEPLHLQKLLNWCNSLQLLLRCVGSPWNLKVNHAQLHCTIIKAQVLEYLQMLALPDTDGTNPQRPPQRWGKSGSGKECRFSNSSFTLLPFGGLTGTFQTPWNTEAFEDWSPVSVLTIKRGMCSFFSRTSLGYAVTPARSEPPTSEAPL